MFWRIACASALPEDDGLLGLDTGATLGVDAVAGGAAPAGRGFGAIVLRSFEQLAEGVWRTVDGRAQA